MKKKLLSILTLLLCVCSGAWADVTLGEADSRYLDITKYYTIKSVGWGDKITNLTNLYDWDAYNSILRVSVYGSCSATSYQKWVTKLSGSYAHDQDWSASGKFAGRNAYSASSDENHQYRFGNGDKSTSYVQYIVTNCIEVSAYIYVRTASKDNYLEVFEQNADGTDPETPVLVEKITNTPSSKEVFITLTKDELDASKVYKVVISGVTGGKNDLCEMAFKAPSTFVSGTITSCGWTSFSNSQKLDLSTLTATNDANAYYASSASDSSVTLTSTNGKVPANTGLMIKGTPGDVFTISTTTDETTALSGNKLVGQTTTGSVAASTDGAYHYVFGFKTSDATDYGFYNLTSDTTVPAGKAYLAVTSVSAPQLSIDIDGISTGINAVQGSGLKVDGEYYNLNGQRVAQPTKGLYIVNGKKVIIK